MQVRLLGPVDITVDGVPRTVSGLRRKAVLAVLALHPGEIVSTDRLIDVIWGDEAPATASNTLQSHVSYLRRVIGTRSAIVARPPGYLLDIPPDATDVEVAERLIRVGTQLLDVGTQSADPPQAAAHLRTALALWRGRSLVDVSAVDRLHQEAERLERLRLVAVRALTDARLALGEHAQLVPELESLVREHQLDERIHEQLMLALYRAGRQSDALATYRRLRRTLDEELGIEPSPTLRDLESAILRQEPGLDLPRPAIEVNAAVPVRASVPAQLPLAVRGFTGRTGELARLDALLPDGPDGAGPAAAVISAVSGTPGVGKTALAVHWAHRVAAHFPDGQLYVNLRGFDAGGLVMDPAEAIRGFLDALGVPVERIPAGLPAQAALYRSLLTGRRFLVVLDNARDAEQVRPLLPGSAGCLAVVTSRNQLTPLIVTEGAHPLALDLLSPTEATNLLAGRLGSDRVSGEPKAVKQIIDSCARLPLALAVATARAATRPGFPLAVLADELRDTADGLDAFDSSEPDTDVRAVFSWSYRALSEPAARLFRLLGLHPGPDIAVPAAASLAGIPPRPARALLAELTSSHLLMEHSPGRYTLHDLLRAYATELTHEHDSEQDRREAVHRLLDCYLHTACAGARLLQPFHELIDPAPARPRVVSVVPSDVEAAIAWFSVEHSVLLNAITRATGDGMSGHAWRLACAMADYFDRTGHWRDWEVTHETALAAAGRLADQRAQARIHYGLGRARAQLGRFTEAHLHLRTAAELYGRVGDPAGQAHTDRSFAWVFSRQGRHREGLAAAERALALFESTGDLAMQARALNSVGWQYAQLHDHRQALHHCQRALVLLQQVGDRSGEANTWDSLGYAHHHLGDHRQATACYQQAITLFRALGDRYYEADTLTHDGDSHQAAGDPDAARLAWLQALDILDALGHPDAEPVRARLLRLTFRQADRVPGLLDRSADGVHREPDPQAVG
ncbi:BTAD domain-containing putative transcriptional regulator [Micromonospora polyrhachis]|uniref:DNA-binding SARP family transcriptional activator n=1 Tax=Micromonospora polyrhachis TaxID=1282883 RepID=A0A7W7SVH5_9ACTN|nr:BTAD domain-containing putative transcriptional regulator [Micromonospora polyrhachis]MBB4961709.1 DNA-binding SARP family transcriptional activator [Micromonospora polyrhachis]